MKRKKRFLEMIFMSVVVLSAAVIWIDRSEIISHAEAENGEAVELPHTHSDNSGACYHHHTDQNGSCYTRSPHSHTSSCYQERDCGGSLGYSDGTCDIGDHEAHKWESAPRKTCNECGASACGFGTLNVVHRRYNALVCGKSYNYSFSCTKNTSAPECSDSVCGSLYIICADTTPGSLTTNLSANIDSTGAGSSAVSYAWSTGETSQGITVSVNGTYSCEVSWKDNKTGAVSTATASYTVDHLDIIPPDVTYTLSPETPTREGVTIHIDATDNVGVTGYSFDGITFSAEQDLYVTENGEYTGYATDASGNTGSLVITVDNIDQRAPEIVSVTKNAEGSYISGTVRVKVTAKDAVSEGYAREISVQYSADGNNWNDNGEFDFTNGTHEIFVRDAAGNVSSMPIIIYQETAPPSVSTAPDTANQETAPSTTDQDTTPPNVSGTQTPQGWTKEGVCLTVTASDDQSGIPERAYKWADRDWDSTSQFHVTANGSYPVTVRDAAGNTSSYVFHVSQIDRTAPDAEACLAISDWHNGTNIIYIQASDQESGLAGSAYSYDGGATWTSAAEYEIAAGGDYLILVQDAAGNIAENRIHAEKKEDTETDISDPAVEEEADGVSEEYHIQRNEKQAAGEEPATSEPTAPALSQSTTLLIPQTDLNGALLSDQEAVHVPKIILSISIPSSSAPASQTIQENADTDTADSGSPGMNGLFPQLLPAAVCGICLCSSIFIILLLNAGKAVLCQKLNHGEYRVVDKTRVKRISGEKGYVVKIADKKICEQIMRHSPATWPYMLRFGKHFAKKHKAEKLKILLSNGRRINTKVEREVTIKQM